MLYESFKIKLNYFVKLLLLLEIFNIGTLSSQSLIYDISGGASKVVIPFEYQNNFIVVNVSFGDNIRVKFIIDSGAEYSIFTIKDIADIIGMKYIRSVKILGADYQTYLTALLTEGIDFKIENLNIKNKNLLVLKDDFLQYDVLTEMNVVGLIGSDILSSFVVKIDYDDKLITLIKPEFFKPSKKFQQTHIDLWRQKPYIKMPCQLVDYKVDTLKFLLDTGAGLSVLFLKNTHPSIRVPENTINGRLGMGLGGYLEGVLGRIPTFQFGTVKFQSLVCNFQDPPVMQDTLAANKRNGIIGNGILSRFDVYLDYTRTKLYFTPNSRKLKEIAYDKSGILLLATGINFNKFIVKDLTPNSPAVLADIRPGDRILSVNHWPSFILNTHFIIKMLSKEEGKLIHIKIMRDGLKIKKQFRLKNLI